jgi:hypothetical protein
MIALRVADNAVILPHAPSEYVHLYAIQGEHRAVRWHRQRWASGMALRTQTTEHAACASGRRTCWIQIPVER